MHNEYIPLTHRPRQTADVFPSSEEIVLNHQSCKSVTRMWTFSDPPSWTSDPVAYRVFNSSNPSSGTIKGAQGHCITMLVPSIQTPSSFAIWSCVKKPCPTTALKVSSYARRSRGYLTSKTQLQTLQQFRVSGGLVFKSELSQGLIVKALQGGGGAPRRLVDVIRAVPQISKAYFKSPFRRALYGGIALLGGFYVAQTISLSFGALGVNDVIAAALCVLVAEYVTKFYHTRTKVTFTIALINNFKMGFTYGLFIDAFKLAS